MAQSVQAGGTRDRRDLVSSARIIGATSARDLSLARKSTQTVEACTSTLVKRESETMEREKIDDANRLAVRVRPSG